MQNLYQCSEAPVEFEVRPEGKYVLKCQTTGRDVNYTKPVTFHEALDLLAYGLPEEIKAIRIIANNPVAKDALVKEINGTTKLNLEGRIFEIIH